MAVRDLPAHVYPRDNDNAAERLRNHRRIRVLGGGPIYATAPEIGLKLKETCFAYAERIQVEEFLHGAVSSVDSKTLAQMVQPLSRRRRF